MTNYLNILNPPRFNSHAFLCDRIWKARLLFVVMADNFLFFRSQLSRIMFNGIKRANYVRILTIC